MAKALTIRYSDIVECITTPVSLKNIFTGASLTTQGIWDTGATNSVITKSAAQELGLKPISRVSVRGSTAREK